MADRKLWRTKRDRTSSLHGRVRAGRVQFGFSLHRHSYFNSPPRYVFQPSVVYGARQRP